MAAAPPPDMRDHIGSGRRRAFGRAAALGSVAVLLAGAARAQVIEIGPSGDATTYDRPTLFTSDGPRLISPVTIDLPRPDISALIAEAAQRQHLSLDLVSEVAWRESRFHQTAVSPRDAVGVMQLTAGTARDLGVDRYDAGQNIHGGAAYLRAMLDRYSGDLRLALAAYNAGPGAVDRYRGVPPFRETQAYVTSILDRLAQRAPAAMVPMALRP